MNWDYKDTGYRQAILFLQMYWPHRHLPEGRNIVKRAIRQAQACKRGNTE